MPRFELSDLTKNPDLVVRNPALVRGTLPFEQATELHLTPPEIFTSEQAFQQAIIDYAKEQGWPKIYHTHDSRHSPEGFPDLFMVRPTREDELAQAVVLECKLPGRKSTKAQAEWIALLNRVPGVKARVVWPKDWEKIKEMLK